LAQGQEKDSDEPTAVGSAKGNRLAAVAKCDVIFLTLACGSEGVNMEGADFT